MTKHVRTSGDIVRYAIVALPLLVLCGMFAASSLQVRIERARLNDTIEVVVGHGYSLDSSTLPRLYDQRTSDESTATWKAVMAAAEAHHSKYGGPFAWTKEKESYEGVFPPGQAWPAAEIISRYASDAKPILKQIETLMDSNDTIWLPILFDGMSTNLNEVQRMGEVSRVLHYSFLDAVHQGDNARGIQMLRMSNRLFGRNYQSTFLVDELIRHQCYSRMLSDIRKSTAKDVWSNEELQELASILLKPVDWDLAWQQTTEVEMFSLVPTIVSSNAGEMASHRGTTSLPLHLSPSRVRAMVQHQHSLALLRGAGTRKHLYEVEKIVNEFYRSASDNASIDRWMQTGTLDSNCTLASVAPAYFGIANTFLHSASEHRFTRTIVAVREFQSKFGKWPDSLSDLTKVGLPQSETNAIDGNPFHHQIEGNAFTIYNQNLGQLAKQDSSRAEEIVMIKCPEAKP